MAAWGKVARTCSRQLEEHQRAPEKVAPGAWGEGGKAAARALAVAHRAPALHSASQRGRKEDWRTAAIAAAAVRGSGED